VDPTRLAGEIRATSFDGWSAAVRADFQENAHNGVVGSVLLSETERVRVWSITLAPGERLGAHRHPLDYFWTALTDGESVQHSDDGSTRYVRYRAGDTRHFDFAPGEYLLHDLENVGTQPLGFVTVEFKQSSHKGSPAS
jgi:quercetin dioxygenase-like cupin family protein